MTPFLLDPQLAADTIAVGDLSLSSLLLMRDARFAWLILVPRQAELAEIVDLAEPDRMRLMTEIGVVSEALRDVAPCDKLNVAAIGNMVRQLHVHVVARRIGDAAWPRPVWGSGAAEPYVPAAERDVLDRLRSRLAPVLS
ncbi:Diadenosine tetraphosphate (Ap4A) hydrolase [Faunimonas pinastri]|uniref:Diadenosine tetraphosphate (Ap4A) hydrolase n=1 Tax=Faunimonas pinastri TaxID=1855383 RepID=A0A1H9HF37_9HYPH|nr:HIT family protein [Faunimonas pinastri]SEQ60925.1 Diadenosine tetraphosphate (Ap4A) hydrolase [Faunimonas pinastri]